MSASYVGASLLADVEVVPLDKLLDEIKHLQKESSTVVTNVVEIDRLLDAIVSPRTLLEEVGDQSLSFLQVDHRGDARSQHHERLLNQTPGRDLYKKLPTLIEVSASEAREEATNLCYLLTAASILADVGNEKEGCVAWLDTETRFSAARLYQVCLHHLARENGTFSQHDQEHRARQALRHVHVFSIQSSKQLLEVLETIPAYLLGKPTGTTAADTLPKHYSAHRCLSLVVLDSATTFHWPDRFEAEIAQLESTASSRSRPASETNASRILAQLKSLHSTFHCVVAYTTDDLTTQLHPRHHSDKENTSKNVLRDAERGIDNHNVTAQVLPPSPPPPPPEDTKLPSLSQWTTMSSLSLLLSSICAPQFSSHMSLDDCLREREKRAEIAQSNRINVSVNKAWLNRVVRDPIVRSALEALNVQGVFVMQCTSRGVDIEKRSY